MTVPYTFGNQSGPIPLSELDVNFANVKAFAITANTVVGNSQPNITTVGILNSLSVSGNVTALNLNAVSTASIGYTLTAGDILSNGVVSASGNLTAGNIITSGSITASGNLIAAIVSATGNINANGNINTPGNINATGNIRATGIISATGNILTSGVISATGNIRTDGNLNVGGYISAVGDIYTAGIISAIGNINTSANVNIDANLQVIGNVYGNSVVADEVFTGYLNAGNVSITGDIFVDGNAQVNGNTTFINTQNLTIADKNIIVANNVSSSALIDGAGIDAGNPTVAYIRYSNAQQGWTTANNFVIGGNAFATTAANGTSNTQLATTKFVDNTIINLNLGTMSTQNANSVNITGGTITGITDLAVADGGTGVGNLTANAVLLGNGTGAVRTLSPGDAGNIMLSDGSTWITSVNNAFGPGQSWQDVTGSRSTGVTYTNSTDKPIFVIAQVGNQTNGIYVYINGTLLIRHWYDVNGGAGQIGYSAGEFMVGPGDTYLVSNGPLRQWWEYRA